MKPVVVIPVFNAFEFLQDCLKSVEESSPDAEIALVNDASTDERVPAFLENWKRAGAGRVLLHNDQNKGFVYSVNRGISRTPGDVVLLNSDTLVTPGWLDAISVCLASDPNIATATPWTNNGEIVSFPDFCVAAPVPADAAEIAGSIFQAGSPEYPELPTAVGFCMAISRVAIDRIGLFDEATFGRGYGEENDFSLRAVEAGMINVLCDDAYVAHHGGGSFSPLGMRPDSESMQRLLGRHPGYRELIEDFILRDPLSGRRQVLIDAIARRHDTMR